MPRCDHSATRDERARAEGPKGMIAGVARVVGCAHPDHVRAEGVVDPADDRGTPFRGGLATVGRATSGEREGWEGGEEARSRSHSSAILGRCCARSKETFNTLGAVDFRGT